MAADQIVGNISSNGGPQFVNNKIVNSNFIFNEVTSHEEGLARQSWLSDIEHWQHHDIISHGLLPGSGRWLLESQQYRMWKDSQEPSILWLHGIPGSGKTNLVACVLNDIEDWESSNGDSDGTADHTSDYPQVDYAYFYCSRGAEDNRRKPDEIIRSLLGQLAFRRENPLKLRESVEEVYLKKKKQAKDRRAKQLEKLSVKDCESLLIRLMREQRTVLIIDALDEVDPESRYILLNALRRIIQSLEKSSRFKLFVSSRDDQDIVLEFRGYQNIYISATDNGSDIARFIETQVSQAIESRRILDGVVSLNLRNEITMVLKSKAAGMFRWCSLQIDALCNRDIKSELGLTEALHSLPETLRESYDAIYEQILALDTYSKLLAQHAILVLLYSKCKLTPSEFVAAVVAGAPRQASDGEENPTPGYIIGLCSNLAVITLLSSYSFVDLAHLSVREYFEAKEEYQGQVGHSAVLYSSVRALLWQTKPVLKFLDYASEFWMLHCTSLGKRRPCGDGKDLISFFLYRYKASMKFNDFNLYPEWNQFLKSRGALNWTSPKLAFCSRIQVDALYVACRYKVPWILEDLSKLENSKWECRQNDFDSMVDNAGILVALKYGNYPAVRFLQNHGLSNYIISKYGTAILHKAVYFGFTDLVELLISRGVDINTKFEGQYPLHEACRGGETRIARTLINCGANINAISEDGQTPLHVACEKNDIDVLKFLVNWDANLDTISKYGQTTLHEAYLGETSIARTLTSDYTNINAISEYGPTHLYVVCESHYIEVVKILIGWDAIHTNIDIIPSAGLSVLLNSCTYYYDDIVNILFRRSASTDTISKNIKSAIKVAYKMIHANLVRVLVENGANTNARSADGRTALYQVCQNKIYNLAKILISHGANIDDRSWGQTPLYTSCQNRDFDMVKFLTGHGANVNITHDGKTALHVVVENVNPTWGNTDWVTTVDKTLNHNVTNLDIVKYLIRHGANLVIRNEEGYTPLVLAARAGNFRAVKCILQYTSLRPESENGRIINMDVGGKRILDFALEWGDANAIGYILACGGTAGVAEYVDLNDLEKFKDEPWLESLLGALADPGTQRLKSIRKNTSKRVFRRVSAE